MNKGQVFIISGPSGSGKGCITKRLSLEPSIHLAVSATTRAPRPGETDGKDYHFISKEAFQSKLDQGQILEYNLYCDHYYGTPIEEMEFCIQQGMDVLLEIDVNGAKQVEKKMDVIKIFIMPPSMKALENRLKGRGSEGEDLIRKRIGEAKREMQEAFSYDYIVVNSDLNQATDEVLKIIDSQKHTIKMMKQSLKEVLENGTIGV